MNNNIPVNHFEEEELTQKQENLIELAEDCGLEFTGTLDEGEPEFIGTAKQFEEYEEKQIEDLDRRLDSILSDEEEAYEAGEIEGCDTHPQYDRKTTNIYAENVYMSNCCSGVVSEGGVCMACGEPCGNEPLTE